MWERRYGFPKPERRPGGSRVFAEADVDKLKLIARALDAGFRAGEVVPLATPDITRLLEATRADVARVSGVALEASDGSTTLDQLLAALRQDDVARFRALLAESAAALGPRGFVVSIAHPLAVRIGELWAQGELGVRHEHVASACVANQLHLLSAAHAVTEGKPLVVLATLPGESHSLPLDMVAVVLASARVPSRMLGADTPPREIAAAAHAMRADVVGISISQAAPPERVEAQVRALLGELPRRTELWIGGAGGAGVALDLPGVRRVDTWDAFDATVASARARVAA